MGSQDFPINGTILLQKAHKLANDLGANFEPNESWIERFKTRENITFHKLPG